MAESNAGIKPKSRRGGARKGAGRKPGAAKAARAEVVALAADGLLDAVEDLLKGLAPRCVANLVKLANGGFEQGEEKWVVPEVAVARGGDATPPAPVPVLIERKVSIAAPDRAANIYLLDRVLGRPKQAVEHSGPGGGAIAVDLFDAALRKVYGDDGDATGPGEPGGA